MGTRTVCLSVLTLNFLKVPTINGRDTMTAMLYISFLRRLVKLIHIARRTVAILEDQFESVRSSHHW